MPLASRKSASVRKRAISAVAAALPVQPEGMLATRTPAAAAAAMSTP